MGQICWNAERERERERVGARKQVNHDYLLKMRVCFFDENTAGPTSRDQL